MNTIEIRADDGRNAFEPGEVMRGHVTWSLDDVPKSVVLRLFWIARGEGADEVKVVEEQELTQAVQQAERPFEVKLPTGPYSFRGPLFSLRWAVEAIAKPSGEVGRLELVVGPGGGEVFVTEVEGAEEAKSPIGLVKQALKRLPKR